MDTQLLGRFDIPERHGIVAADDLPGLFRQFDLNFPEGLAFPFQHKWSPPPGREREAYERRQSTRLVLVIQPHGQYIDDGGVVDGHFWQLLAERFD